MYYQIENFTKVLYSFPITYKSCFQNNKIYVYSYKFVPK
jgi:hypothetical protein